MKKWVILLFCMLFVSYVSAQGYDNFKDLELDFSIGSSLDLVAGNNPSLERLEVFLKLYPRKDFRQELMSFDIKSEPEAETNFNDLISYKWTKLSGVYTYSVNSNVRTKNKFDNVRSKINFPPKKSEMDEFLIETEFIDINDEIREKANQIIAGEDDYYEAVFKIGEWVRQNINYDLNTLTAEAVQKSSWVLEHGEGVCDELTNLFISMSRSVVIPARFITGTVHANAIGGFGNHGWAEVYFPGIGWLPFDVTFGQYGWVDATHLKLAETADSGESSVDYRWLSSNLDIKPKNLRLKTRITEEGEKYKGLVKLSLLPLNEKFKFGSYLMARVNIENLQNHYLTTRVYLTRAPSKTEGETGKVVLLKPKETKVVYWLMKLSEGLEEDLVYSSVIEVEESFGERDAVMVIYGNEGKYVSLEELADTVREIETVDEKEMFSEFNIECEEDDTEYKTGDKIVVNCKLSNKGTIELEDLNICFNNDCSLEDFGINEEKEFVREIEAIDNVVVSASNDNLVRKKVLKYNYVKVPRLLITKIRPEEVDYNVETEVMFFLSSNDRAYDVEIDIKGYKTLYIDELAGEKEISLNINSKNLRKGLIMHIKYRDEKNSEYEYDWNYPFKVENVPWYVKILEKMGI